VGSYTLTATFADGGTILQTIMLSTSGAAASLVIDGVTGTTAIGALLAGDETLYVDNSSGGFTSDELAGIQDAIAGVESLVSLYGANIVQVDSSVGQDANIVIDSSTTSVLGGVADGVLGVTTSAGEVTIIQGWNWYAGSDPSAIGSAQYDFQSVITHELGHALGLGHSTDTGSVMYPELATAAARRSMVAADLNIAEDGGDGSGLHVEPLMAVKVNSASTAQTLPPDRSTAPSQRITILGETTGSGALGTTTRLEPVFHRAPARFATSPTYRSPQRPLVTTGLSSGSSSAGLSILGFESDTSHEPLGLFRRSSRSHRA
jgi:hypothetical protein